MTFSKILYGGDYNPNQWPQEVWREDMRIFKEAAINSATINVFSWAKIQPAEEEYNFQELDEIVDLLSKENYQIVLATSTAALPAWMFKKYPEVGRRDFNGRLHRFGQRHNACPHSLVYQKFASRLVAKLAERYGKNSHVSCWHINNEYGGECYCEKCEAAFRVWLKERYGTIAALNQAWNLEFWGHTVYAWDEIVTPNGLGDAMSPEKTAFAGLSLDYRRFMSDSLLANYQMERDIIRQYDATTPITTNLMGTYKGLDYFKWAKEMDVVSWDNYPAYDTPWSSIAMKHDLMRGLKKQPFMLMEQTPSQQNWQAYNSLKKPGQMRAQSYQSIAHGADTIQFFQLRRSVGGCEKFHGAVIEHVGHEDTRVFREVAQLGKELAQLPALIGAKNHSEVAIVFDWDNYWSLEYTSGPNVDLKYVAQIQQYYRYFYDRHIPVDLVAVDADFSQYKMVVAPVLYLLKDDVAERLTSYVEQGGHFLTTFMSGIVGASDNVILGGYPGPFRKLCGVWAEEIDALAPEQHNTIAFTDGTLGEAQLLCDLLHLEGAQSYGSYTSNFYAGQAFATKNNYGKGQAFYVGTQLVPQSLDHLLDQMTADLHLTPTIKEATPLEVTQRVTKDQVFTFVMNFTGTTVSLPQTFAGETDALTGNMLNAETPVAPFATYLIISKR